MNRLKEVWMNKPGIHVKAEIPDVKYHYIKYEQLNDFVRWCNRHGFDFKVFSKETAYKLRWEYQKVVFTSGGGWKSL